MGLGPFAGPIYLIILVVDCLFFMFLEWWFPRDDMDFVVRHWDHDRFAQVGVPVRFSENQANLFLLVRQSGPGGLRLFSHAFKVSYPPRPYLTSFLSQLYSNCYSTAPRSITLIIGAQWSLHDRISIVYRCSERYRLEGAVSSVQVISPIHSAR